MKNFINFKSLLKPFKNQSFGFGHNFTRDWVFVMIISTLIFIVFISGAFWLSVDLIKKQEEPVVANRSVISLNRETLSKMVEFYKDQEKKFEITKGNSVKYKDPSK